MIRTLGVGSWWHDSIDRRHGGDARQPAFKLAYGTRADRCNGGWLVVRVKRGRR